MYSVITGIERCIPKKALPTSTHHKSDVRIVEPQIAHILSPQIAHIPSSSITTNNSHTPPQIAHQFCWQISNASQKQINNSSRQLLTGVLISPLNNILHSLSSTNIQGWIAPSQHQ